MGKLSRAFFGLLITCSLSSCGRDKRLHGSDEAEIIANYSAFKDAIISHDSERAKIFLTPSSFQNTPLERVIETYSGLTNSDQQITKNAFVISGKTGTWLFPQRGGHGATGYGFVKETNHWKLNGELISVED